MNYHVVNAKMVKLNVKHLIPLVNAMNAETANGNSYAKTHYLAWVPKLTIPAVAYVKMVI